MNYTMTVHQKCVRSREASDCLNELDDFSRGICRPPRSALGNSARISCARSARVGFTGERGSKVHQFKEMRRRRTREISFLPRAYGNGAAYHRRFSAALVKIVTVVSAERNRGSTFRTRGYFHRLTHNEYFIALFFPPPSFFFDSYRVTIAIASSSIKG